MSGNVVGWVYDNYPAQTALERNRKVVLSEVAEAANRDYCEAHPGVAKIARHWGFDPGTVRRHLKALVADKWLEVTEEGGGRGKATVFRVCRERGALRAGLDDTNARNPDEIRAHSEDDTRAFSDSVHISQAEALLQPPARTSVEQVFDAWKEAAKRNGTTRLLDGRRRAIEKALKAYPLDEVLDAVRGWQRDPWHAGQNDRGTAVNEIEYLLRGSNVEKFRDLWRCPSRQHRAPAAESKLDMIAEHFGLERNPS